MNSKFGNRSPFFQEAGGMGREDESRVVGYTHQCTPMSARTPHMAFLLAFLTKFKWDEIP